MNARLKQFVQKNDSLFKNGINAVFLIITSLVLPALLLPVIKLTGYSEIVEEIAKALVILFIIFNFASLKQKVWAGIFLGLLYGVSENIFYLNQIIQLGDLSVFWQRLLWTTPMHIITILIMLFAGSVKKWYIIFGLIGAIVLHALFNIIIAG